MPLAKTSRRSRAKSTASALPTAVNQTVLLRVEPRLKWSGSIDLVPIAGGGGRTIQLMCRDDKLKLDLEWRGLQASEAAALIEAFTVIEAWVEETREQQRGPDRSRLQTVIDQLRVHRRQLVTDGVPATQAEASAKEAAVDDFFTANECNRDGTAWSLAEWTERLNQVADIDAWRTKVGRSAADESLATWYHDGLTIVEAAREIDESIDGEMDLRDDEPEGDPSLLQELPLEEIRPSALNPRQVFDKESLRDLAKSIKTVGLLQPIVVYRSPGKTAFEIIAGERRYRAAQIAAQPTILCRVLDCTEEQAIELRVVENLKREDLNPIDEARGFQQMLDRCGYSQRTLAARLGVSQGHVGNRLGLLRLPEVWQRRVITGDISPTMARELIPWMERPTVLAEIERVIAGSGGEGLTTQEFAAIVRDAVRELTLPVETGKWYRIRTESGNWRSGSVLFRAKELARYAAELDIVEVATRTGGTERRAFAVQRWLELHGNLEARHRAKQEKKSVKGSQAASTSEDHAAAERQRRAKQDELLRQRLSWYRVRWYQGRILDRFNCEGGDDQLDGEHLLRLVLYFGAHYGGSCGIQDDRRDSLLDALREVLPTGATKPLSGTEGLWQVLAAAEEPDLWRVLSLTLRRWLERDPQSRYSDLQADDVPRIAAVLGIDLERDWRVERSFLELHTVVQLQARATAWNLDVPFGKREDLINAILAADKSTRLPVPADLVRRV